MKITTFVALILLLALPVHLVADEIGIALQLVNAAREQVGVTTSYDGSYRQLRFPGGDVPIETGVCSDVIVRSYRAQGIDLQLLLHEDMKKHFKAYPQIWGLERPDPNIDHRRVPNLRRFFERKNTSLLISSDPSLYAPGDIVTWNLGERSFSWIRKLAGRVSNIPHIGIITDRRNEKGVPLIVHNIGAGTKEEDILFEYKITGHYRFLPEVSVNFQLNDRTDRKTDVEDISAFYLKS